MENQKYYGITPSQEAMYLMYKFSLHKQMAQIPTSFTVEEDIDFSVLQEKTHERDILERLELKLRPLVKELQYYFNGHTTIDTSNDYLVFNIKEIMDKKYE